MMQFAAAFAGRGDDVDVISARADGVPVTEVVDGVNVYRIRKRAFGVQSVGGHVFETLAFVCHAMLALGAMHLRKPYDLIHVQSVPDFLVFAAVVPKLTGTPIILDLRDLVPELFASKFCAGEKSLAVRVLRVVERVSARLADHVIVANPMWHKKIVSRSVSKEKCSIFWYYPDKRLFFPRARQRSSGKFVIMYPGTLHVHQGVDVAIRAFPGILRAIPEAEFRIIGDGPVRSELVALSEQLGLTAKVFFESTVPVKVVAERMAEADIGIVPKRASNVFGNEAASTKIPEFLALGVPVVVSDTSIERCSYESSVVRYFRSEDEKALAEAVVAIHADPALRDSLISSGLTYSRMNEWSTRIQAYLGLVERLQRGRSVPVTRENR